MKFGSKRAIFGVIWGGFEGFGPCLGVSHPTHPHLGEISQKKRVFFGSPPYHSAMLVFESFTQPSSITTANVMKKDGGVLLYVVNKDDFKDRFPRS